MEKVITLLRRDFKLKTLLMVFLLLLMSFTSFAQKRTISGVVTASDNNETLPGATVLVKGTTTGTVTDMDGKYALEVPVGPLTLEFSYVGYAAQEIAVTDQSVINVILEPSKVSLDEVVVIGYGTVKKSDLTGSVASIKADEITKITASNPIQSLQGKVAGVQVTSTSGAPGDNPIVRIRGVGTFNNASPIYVVDGVIVDDISYLNASDIASMEVLKDASATAIYGSRGANGVIMVTTKSGKGEEGKTVFQFTGEVGMQTVAKKIDLLDGRQFAIISNEIKTGSYNNVDAVPNTDWQDLIFQAAPIQNYQLSASGASKSISYYIGVGYFNQQGIVDKSSYEKITTKLNSTYDMTSWLRVGTNISITPFDQQIAPAVVYAAYRAQPVLKPYYDDGSFGVVYNVGNPLASLENSNNFRKGVRGVGNFYGQATFLKDFTFKTSFGLDGEYIKSENFTPAYTVYNPLPDNPNMPDFSNPSQQNNEQSDLFKASSDMLSWLWENTLTYQKDFGKNSVNALAGYTMQNTSSSFFNISGANIIRDDPTFWYIYPNYVYDESNSVNTVSSISDGVDINNYYSMISYLFRVNYTFDRRYIVTATFRRDGSSKFATNNRYSNFPSFAAGWNISQEKFMQNMKVLDKLKLRASWGKIGNEKIAYGNRYSGVDQLIAIFGSEAASNAAATFGKLGNNDLIWEVTSQTDVGLEVGLWEDKLTGEFDYYHRVTDKILVDLVIPGYYGNGVGQRITYNAAKVLNTGFEFNVGWRDQVGEFKYNISANGSTVHNEVLDIGGKSGADSTLTGGYIGNGASVTRTRNNLPIGAFYGYQTDGVFQTQAEIDAYASYARLTEDAQPGDLKYVDTNGDGYIDPNDRVYLGSSIPKFIFGFNFGLEYKGLDFSVNIQGQTGNKIFNAKEVVRPDPYNFEAHVFDRWTGPGTSDTEPRPTFGGNNYLVSDHFLYDGSFVRVRNVILGYTLPKKWSNAAYMSTLRIYIKADNLYTYTKFTGYTPEIGSSSPIDNGIDNGIYPVTAVYSFGVNLTF